MSDSTSAARAQGADVLADGAAIGLVSAGICLYSHEPAVMLVLVLLAFAARTVLWRLRHPGRPLGRELGFLALCTVLGAFNDWSTVDRHGVYEYTVPHELPQISTIPLWMLLYWGLILRFLATLCASRLGSALPVRRDEVRLGPRVLVNGRLKVLLELGLVLLTRQAIYAFGSDPVLSWAPFLAAALVHRALFGWDRHDRRLALLAATVGTAVEVLYIQAGGLHRYALGWFGGVPLWIVLWWALALLIWKDLTLRRREVGCS
jgi:hypothetical protein